MPLWHDGLFNTIGGSLKEYGEWAQREIDLLSYFVKSGDLVIDVGAFIGTHTLAFSALVGKDGLIHSFEPQTLSFKELSLNITRNSLSNVKLFNVAVSDEETTLTIGNIPSDLLNYLYIGFITPAFRQTVFNITMA